jgi:hypothetical protein
MHQMMQEMSMPERGAQAQAPAGVQYQKAGVQLLDDLTNRLDREIEKAGEPRGMSPVPRPMPQCKAPRSG